MDNLTFFGLASGMLAAAAFIYLLLRLAVYSKRWAFRALFIIFAFWWAVVFVACANAIWQGYASIYF